MDNVVDSTTYDENKLTITDNDYLGDSKKVNQYFLNLVMIVAQEHCRG